MAGNRKRKQPSPNLHEIIAAKREEKEAARPNWFYIARSAHPQTSAYGLRLFKQQEKLEKQSETQTTDEGKWAAIEQQLRGELPEEFKALDALQQHVNTFTACNPTIIEKLFAGLETEEERLAVILPHIKFPEPQTEGTSGLHGEDGNDESEDSVEMLYQNLTAAEVEDAKRKKNAEKRRRYQENLKKRRGDPELQRAAEEARHVNEHNAEMRRRRHEQGEAEDTGDDEVILDE
ncbi:hypothetical protein EDD36DRAFT_258422 [Exophiala viscosa]|uniref:Uncharacterized protein n=1 Tax=Exophiala viscosa TaxID=2486360 RepID=A0AAN6DV72_9EURO|nr:hypothetical protein EDD36DRAFT_258422 [Exophiala viscosa]